RADRAHRAGYRHGGQRGHLHILPPDVPGRLHGPRADGVRHAQHQCCAYRGAAMTGPIDSMAKEIAYRETAARMAAETIAAQQAEIRRLESENARLRAAAEKVSDWHQHATGCPVSEMDAPSDAECDCGLGAIRA